jgi:DNA polymerase V
VLHCPYDFEKTRLIVREMTDLLVLDLVDKGLVTDQLVLTIGYDIENLTDPTISKQYHGEVVTDHYGRRIPKHAHGTVNLPRKCSSTTRIMKAVTELFDRIVDPGLLVRRINITACHVIPEGAVEDGFWQMDLFAADSADETEDLEREKRRQKAVLQIKRKYGKNAIVKGMNLEEGATAMDRNQQIGGHKA